MATQAAPQRSLSLPLHRLDAATYGRMVASGALDGEPVELLEGMLVDMSPHGPEHAAAIEELTRHLMAARARLRVQLPVEISPDSVPEPDLALVEGRSPGRHPHSALLVVEVAATSQDVDRTVKAALYARAAIPTYWLIDIPGRAVEVRTDPSPEGYRQCEIYRAGAQAPSPAPGVPPLDVGWLFERVRD